MSNVWFAIPSARPVDEAQRCMDRWKERGYKIATFRDLEAVGVEDLSIVGPYTGYAAAVNTLCREILVQDPKADWIVTGGDDTLPDPNHSPQEVAAECVGRCVAHVIANVELWNMLDAPEAATFGVMQPTGDRWQDSPATRARYGEDRGALIDRVAGSPWLGREFCKRMYQGRGPLFEGYRHMFCDEELQCVAEKLGVFWQRRDLIHYHDHYVRRNNDQAGPIPEHLKQWTTAEHWREAKALFEIRKAAGFPGHEPL